MMKESGVRPRVYFRLTDNWVELSVRFVTLDHATREVKDAIYRELLDRFDEAGIKIASTTFDIVGLPNVRLEGASGDGEPREWSAGLHRQIK